MSVELVLLVRACELFADLAEADCARVAGLAGERRVRPGEAVLRFGAEADTLFIVAEGRVELTVPLLVMGESKEVRFQSLEAGRALAWSALVPPHRLTMGARAATDVRLLGFGRAALLALLGAEPRIGYAVFARLADVISARFQETQALWVREVQRNVAATYR